MKKFLIIFMLYFALLKSNPCAAQIILCENDEILDWNKQILVSPNLLITTISSGLKNPHVFEALEHEKVTVALRLPEPGNHESWCNKMRLIETIRIRANVVEVWFQSEGLYSKKSKCSTPPSSPLPRQKKGKKLTPMHGLHGQQGPGSPVIGLTKR